MVCVVALASQIAPRLLWIDADSGAGDAPPALVSRLPGELTAVAGVEEGITRLTRLAPDIVLVYVGNESGTLSESLALLVEILSDTPLVVVSESRVSADIREALGNAAHQCVDLSAHSKTLHSDVVALSIGSATMQRGELLANARYRRLYENAIAAILSFDARGNLVAANPAAVSMMGCQSASDLLQQNFVDQICTSQRVGNELMRLLTETGSIRNAELTLRRYSGGELTVMMCANSVLDALGEVVSMEATMIDVTEHKRAKDELTYLAKFDRLTGLSNRYLFKEALSRDIARANRSGGSVSLIMIDLDRFKEVNDSLGHDAGDALLRAVATRLKQCTRQGDVVARLGGDEFAVLIENPDRSMNAVTAVVRKISRTLGKPYQLNGHEILTSPSIGIATTPDAGRHGDALLKAADIAMYRAKAEGRDRFVFYTDSLHKEVVMRVALEKSLRRAVDDLDFRVEYQPKVNLRTGKIVELEALLRWTCPDRGPISPVEFIPVLERTGLINPVGNWVIRTAANDLRKLQRSLDLPDLAVSVNLSVRQLAQQQMLIDHIASTLDETNLDPICLEFEITESSLMNDPDRCIETLDCLRDLGVRVSIDDFGTGFSSLQYLKALPIHSIKIDRAFVRDVPDSANDIAIIKATLALAKSLELTVTAEGIETAEQAQFLRELNCDMGQGYYFARPTELRKIPQLLKLDPNRLTEVAEEVSASITVPDPAPDTGAFEATSTVPLPYFATRSDAKH